MCECNGGALWPCLGATTITGCWSCELVPPVSCPPAARQTHRPGLKSFVVKIGGDIGAEKCEAGNSVSTEVYRGGEHMVWEGERAATENGSIHESW